MLKKKKECYDNNYLHVLEYPGLCGLVIHPEINKSCLHTFSVYGSYVLCPYSFGIISKIFFPSHDFISSPQRLISAVFSQPTAPLQIFLHILSPLIPFPVLVLFRSVKTQKRLFPFGEMLLTWPEHLKKIKIGNPRKALWISFVMTLFFHVSSLFRQLTIVILWLIVLTGKEKLPDGI